MRNLAEQEFLPLVKLFPTIVKNVNDQESVWPRPEEWPDDWPWSEAMWEDPRGDLCELCHESNCDCIHRPLRVIPRIKGYGTQGRGLRAVASVPGEVAYKQGDILVSSSRC